MSFLGKTVLGPHGISFGEIDVRLTVRNAAGVAVGEIMELDLSESDAAVTTLAYGDAASGYSNVIAPAGITKKMTVFGVALEAGADDETVTFRIFGKAKVLMDDTSGVPALVAIGDEGHVQTNGEADINSAATGRVVCRAEAAGTGVAGTTELIDCFFNGMPASA